MGNSKWGVKGAARHWSNGSLGARTRLTTFKKSNAGEPRVAVWRQM